MASCWFMFAFLLTASYGGNLRAILLAPRVGKLIKTMEDIFESGLPWSMPLYGEELDIWLAGEDDPMIKRFWEENQPPEGYDEYQYNKVDMMDIVPGEYA